MFLADGNLLIALTVDDHVHYERAQTWFEDEAPVLATCPITEGTLLRFLMRAGKSATESIAVLDTIRGQSWHRFWTDDIPYDGDLLSGVIGHRQVTDAYLVALARGNEGRLATFDKGLATTHGNVIHLLNG